MSDNGWPDPARPGVPLNPERDGWHWLFDSDYNSMEWDSASFCWFLFAEKRTPTDIVKLGFQYEGPALTPAEVDARVQQARRDAREQVARYHDLMAKMAGSSTELQRRSLWEHSESAKDIRSGRDIRVLGEKE